MNGFANSIASRRRKSWIVCGLSVRSHLCGRAASRLTGHQRTRWLVLRRVLHSGGLIQPRSPWNMGGSPSLVNYRGAANRGVAAR
jgi:hypothetical protein